MRILYMSVLSLALAACGGTAATEIGTEAAIVAATELGTATEMEESTVEQSVKIALPDLGAAPELQNEIWLNTDQPLRLAELRGKVVLLDMWTFGCINCQRVIPHLREWHEQYQDQGLLVIGNHYPEFGYEQSLANLQEALVRLDVPYPVAQDNDRATWSAYQTRFWPTLFLIDKRGHIRYTHIGEGRYTETESAIQALLAENYP